MERPHKYPSRPLFPPRTPPSNLVINNNNKYRYGIIGRVISHDNNINLELVLGFYQKFLSTGVFAQQRISKSTPLFVT